MEDRGYLDWVEDNVDRGHYDDPMNTRPEWRLYGKRGEILRKRQGVRDGRDTLVGLAWIAAILLVLAKVVG